MRERIAFNKKTHKQLEVTVRINENQSTYPPSVLKVIMKSDAKQPKLLLKELTGIDEIDRDFDFGNYLDARNPETGEIISTAREDGKASGVELPEEIEIPACMETFPTHLYVTAFMKTLNDKEFVTFCNALYFEIKSKEQAMKDFGFTKDSEMKYLEDYVPAVGDKLVAGEKAKTERLLITSTVLIMMSSMHDPLYEEVYHIKETKAGKLALEMDGYVGKLIWRKWDTNYLEELVKQVMSKDENQTLRLPAGDVLENIIDVLTDTSVAEKFFDKKGRDC